jgi:hypothetical protein
MVGITHTDTLIPHVNYTAFEQLVYGFNSHTIYVVKINDESFFFCFFLYPPHGPSFAGSNQHQNQSSGVGRVAEVQF